MVKQAMAMAVVVTVASLLGILAYFQQTILLLQPGSTEGNSLVHRVLQSSLPRVRGVGNDGGPNFPLGLCEGDCDSDRDCSGDLVCFQRDPWQAVPGCRGGDRDRTQGDYCVPPAGDVDIDIDGRDGGGNGGGDNVEISNQGSFFIKLYWQPNYFWQEERRERKWCMKCRARRCRVNSQVYVVNCDRDRPTRFFFNEQGDNAVQIRVARSNLCLERNGRRDIRVRRCESKTVQLWQSPRGGFETDRFEIAPTSDYRLCMTQRHHPKRGEIVQLESCQRARRDTTAYWNRYLL